MMTSQIFKFDNNGANPAIIRIRIVNLAGNYERAFK